jgi:hypothetical protein
MHEGCDVHHIGRPAAPRDKNHINHLRLNKCRLVVLQIGVQLIPMPNFLQN